MRLGSPLRTSKVSAVTFHMFLYVFPYLPLKELYVGISICKHIRIVICGFCSCFSFGLYFRRSIPFQFQDIKIFQQLHIFILFSLNKTDHIYEKDLNDWRVLYSR